ncbi:MAG: universal stress protein [Acidimicrobiales bacterium]
MYRSVLVATDGSDTAAEAVRVAAELARTFGATLHIANVTRAAEAGPLATGDMTMALLAASDRARAKVEAIAEQARSEGISVTAHTATGNIAERIVALAEEHHVDLIVVGNRGMRGLKRGLGSVPNAVAHTASCAVLIVNTT